MDRRGRPAGSPDTWWVRRYIFIGIAAGAVPGLFGGGGGILAIPCWSQQASPPTRPGPPRWSSSASARSADSFPHARAGRVDWKQGFIFSASESWALAGSRLALVTEDRIQL